MESDDQLQSGLSSSVLARSHWQQALNAVTSQTMVRQMSSDVLDLNCYLKLYLPVMIHIVVRPK